MALAVVKSKAWRTAITRAIIIQIEATILISRATTGMKHTILMTPGAAEKPMVRRSSPDDADVSGPRRSLVPVQ